MDTKVNKIPVAVLGATGMVGQKFISLLENHPFFEITAIGASERSHGIKYGEIMKERWKMEKPIPINIKGMIVQSCDFDFNAKIVFSGLDSSVAGEIEENYAKKGYIVISNSKNHRMDPYVPLMIPEINADHLSLLNFQPYKGKIITNPNCSTIGMTLALAPVEKAFGLKKIIVTTMQAVSGAGYPGVASLDILDNIVPFISGEEEKMEKETLKIFGEINDKTVENAQIKVSATCNRVPIINSHMECISFSLEKKANIEDIKNAFLNFNPLKKLNLPSAPIPPVILINDDTRPQHRYDRYSGNGMAVTVGRLRQCAVLDYKMTILSHNTIRGAAGCAILIAELLKAKGVI